MLNTNERLAAAMGTLQRMEAQIIALSSRYYAYLLGGASTAFAQSNGTKIYNRQALINLTTSKLGNALRTTGGVMRYYLSVHAQPTQSRHLANKGYADDQINGHNHDAKYLSTGGGTLGGHLSLDAVPTHPNHLCNKAYVDSQFPTPVGASTSNLPMQTDITPLGAQSYFNFSNGRLITFRGTY